MNAARSISVQRPTPIRPDEIGGMGCVLLMPMNEGTGDPKDYSGYNNHGTRYGATWVDAGRYGKALSFDGVDDYVDCGNKPSLNSTAYTLEVRFKTTAISPDSTLGQRIVQIEREDASTKIVLMMRNNKPQLAWADAGVIFKELSTNTIANDGVWHHLVGTTDGVNFKVYLDGVVKNSLSSSLTAAYYDVKIGSLDGAQAFFKGLIAKTSIYNRKKFDDEIKANFLGARILKQRGLANLR